MVITVELPKWLRGLLFIIICSFLDGILPLPLWFHGSPLSLPSLSLEAIELVPRRF